MRPIRAWKAVLVLALASCDEATPTREQVPSTEHAATEHAAHHAAGHHAAEHEHHATDHAAHAHHEPLPALEAPDARASLHDLPDVFHDPEGNAVTFRDFHGHPTLVAMFYGSCTTVCPLILSDLAAIDEAVSSDRLRLAVATFDPERDTPERLRALREERAMDATRWKLLRGDEESTRNLAMAIGVQYRELSDGEYAHSALLVLLDGEGRLVARHEGLGRPLDDLIARTRAMAGEAP